ncbi:MAG: hypothetical protein KatS3mg109_1972 [Pirellulaceae bacterium]|nr:MAG: hypothetical protein KatS3mg109_1972 [Pirellulaceae bacterium]
MIMSPKALVLAKLAQMDAADWIDPIGGQRLVQTGSVGPSDGPAQRAVNYAVEGVLRDLARRYEVGEITAPEAGTWYAYQVAYGVIPRVAD